MRMRKQDMSEMPSQVRPPRAKITTEMRRRPDQWQWERWLIVAIFLSAWALGLVAFASAQ
jgi:hypothetical protein